MSSKTQLFKENFSRFFHYLKLIFSDVVYAYKNFLHWNFSKILSFLISVLLWLMIALPIIILVIVVAFIDPINWIQVLWAESFLGQLQNMENILWSLGVFLLSGIAFLLLFIGSSFYLIFLLKLFHSYIDRKPIKYKKLIKFERKEVFCFLRIAVFSFLAIFSPVFVWTIVWSTWSYLIGPAFDRHIITTLIISLVYILIVYITYKVQFAYIIFAKDSKKKKSSFTALYYIKESIKLARPKHFITFILIVLLYFIILLPFRSIDTILEQDIGDIQNTYNFRNDLFTNLSEGDRQYLSLVAIEYEEYSDSELIDTIRSKYTMRIIHFIVSYILFWGLILLIVTSFYRRILLKK